MFDAIIIGGSTAGLTAALYLGRFRRKILIVDSQKPANRFSHAAHGFFTRDGVSPAEIVAIGRDQLRPYETVTLQSGIVTQITRADQGFQVMLEDGSQHTAGKILLATGLKDTLPPITNIEQFWGTSVFHCPYCDGWEHRDQPVAILNKGKAAIHHTNLMSALTSDLVICTNGPSEFDADQQAFLLKHSMRVIETPIQRVEGHGTQLEHIIFADGTTLARKGILVGPTLTQNTDFAAQLGCEFMPNGNVKVDDNGRTSISGVYAAGDMAYPARQLIFAASQGALAAIGINMDLIDEHFSE